MGDEARSTCAQAQLAECRLRVVGSDWAGRLAGCVYVCECVSERGGWLGF